MSRRIILFIVAIGVLALGGCGFDLFEDVQTDPHPPRLFDLVVSPLTVGFEGAFTIQVGYEDEGADIVSITLKDLDSAGSWSILPPAPKAPEGSTETEPAPEFFPGTRGIAATDPESPLSMSFNQPGEHRIQVWAEDSHGSRSEKLQFVITVII